MISSYYVPDQIFKRSSKWLTASSNLLGICQVTAAQDYNSKNKQKNGHVSSPEKKGRATTAFRVISCRSAQYRHSVRTLYLVGHNDCTLIFTITVQKILV